MSRSPQRTSQVDADEERRLALRRSGFKRHAGSQSLDGWDCPTCGAFCAGEAAAEKHADWHAQSA